MEQVILSDENCGKHAEIIFHALERLGLAVEPIPFDPLARRSVSRCIPKKRR